jgi:hypothetical protein
MLALLLLLPLVLSEAGAMTRLDQLRAGFARRPKKESMLALQQLADDAAGTAAAGQALAWLGNLWRGEHEDALAASCYRRAQGSRDRQSRMLAERGLGDLALNARRYGPAAALYREALADAGTEVLQAELGQKLALAVTGQRRTICEWLAWIFVAVVTIGLGIRSRWWRRPRPALPIEVLYATPVYGVLIAACSGRDGKVLYALSLIAFGSLALIGTSALSTGRAPLVGWRRGALAVFLSVANAALFFAACNRAGILDSLMFTVAP